METHALQSRTPHSTTTPTTSLTRRKKCPQNITFENTLEKLNNLNLYFRFQVSARNFFAGSGHNIKLIRHCFTLA